MDGSKRDRDQRPRLLMVYADSVHAAQCSRFFRRHGWDVHLSSSGEQARQQVEQLAPAAVVLDADVPAWQSCAHQIHGRLGATIVIVAANAAAEEHRCDSIGAAAFVSRNDGPQALADRVFAASM